jgi:arginine decarboxylase
MCSLRFFVVQEPAGGGNHMTRSRTRLDQSRAHIYEALENFRQMRVVPFDVPGHKRGRGNPELTAFLGKQCVGVDVNSMKPLDNLCHPVSVIREAEELAADGIRPTGPAS